MATPLPIRIDNRLRMPLAAIPKSALARMKGCTEHENPEFKKRKAMGYATWDCPAVIKTWRETDTEFTLPRGAMGRVRKILKELRVPYVVSDERQEGAPLLKPLNYRHDLREPRGYQTAAADKVIEIEQGVVRAATGAGKTTTMIYAASRIGLNTLVVLPSVKLMNQTKEVAEKLLGKNVVGVIRGSTKTLRPFTVATQQTLWSRTIDKDIDDFFGAVMIDEGHHAAAKTFQDVIDQFKCRYRIAFTADERRKDRKEFLVYDAFGQVIHEMSREACEDLGVVVDVEIRVVFSDFEAPWYRREPDFNRLLDEMTGDEKRNKLIADLMHDEIEGSDVQAIACTHRREHARLLDGMLVGYGISSGVMLGGDEAMDSREFELVRQGLITGEMRAGIGTYGALGEGIDLPAVTVGVAATPISSNKQKFNQFRGRLCRPSAGKTQGRLYVVFDRRVFDERHFGNILSWNRTVRVKMDGRWVDARSLTKRAIMTAA